MLREKGDKIMERFKMQWSKGDPWVWCKNCQALLQVDAMDASCRLCSEFQVLSQDQGKEVIESLQKVVEPKRFVAVGNTLVGYCEGYFGRDSYEDKRIINLGPDWIVAVDEKGNLHTAQSEGLLARMEDYMKRLSVGKESRGNFVG